MCYVFTEFIALVCTNLRPALDSAPWATSALSHLATFAALAHHFFVFQLLHVPDDPHSSNFVVYLQFGLFPTSLAIGATASNILIHVVDSPPTL